MNEVSTFSIAIFGFLLGVKHAVEADHIAAVSTIVSEERTLFRSSLVGAFWGVGHTVSLFVAATVIIGLHIELSARMSLAMEFGVGLMLIAFGINALRKLLRGGRLHMHVHQHGRHRHTHPHIHDCGEQIDLSSHHGLLIAARPIFMGVVHGLAGTGALMLLVLSTIHSPPAALLYVVLFGIGSTAGMTLMSLLVGLPAKFTAQRFALANTFLRGAAGIFSVGLGLMMLLEISFGGKLFG